MCRRKIFRLSGRPYFTSFDFNTQEEREITEAIAIEEERMKLEGTNQGIYDGINISKPRAVSYMSHLAPKQTDTPDDKVIKQLLDGLITQVIRWEKNNWSTSSKDSSVQREKKKLADQDRRLQNERDLLLAEHVERLKKEINKRRTKIENEAEALCGIPTPWRKSKTKTHRDSTRPKKTRTPRQTTDGRPPLFLGLGSRSTKERSTLPQGASSQPAPLSSTPRQVVNPADITLGGDAVDWTKKVAKKHPEAKQDSIAVGVARRRRTSTMSKEEHEERKRKEKSVDEISKKRRRTPSRSSDLEKDASNCRECNEKCDVTQFAVICDLCKNSYHGECVAVSKKQADKMTGWTCAACISEARRVRESPQLFCVCQLPYDDSRFYVGCDSCEDWFHPDCVGTEQKYCEKLEHYICPMCVRKQEEQANQGYESSSSEASVDSRTSFISSYELTRYDYKYLVQLNEVLNEHHMSHPFKTPVDLNKYRDYLSVVGRPVDLSMITEKIQALEYRTLGEFTADVHQMFENAKIYFGQKDQGMFTCAEVLEEVFEGKLNETKEQIRAEGRQRNRTVSESRTLEGSLDIDTDQLLNMQLLTPQFFQAYLD